MHEHSDNNETTLEITESNLLTEEIHAVVRTGKALQSAGAESYRVRRSMGQVASALGLDQVQSHVSLSELTVTGFKGEHFRTQVGQIHSVGVNADKLIELARLTDRLCPGVTPTQIESKLDSIDARGNLYGRRMTGLWGGLGCAAFAFLNNGGVIEVLSAFIAASLGQFVRAVILRKRINQYVAAFLSGLVAAAFYVMLIFLTGLFGWDDPSGHEAGFVAAILFLVPGFPLVAAALDFAKSYFVAGLSRLAYSLMILFAGALALMAVSGLLNITPTELPSLGLPIAWLWILRFVAGLVGIYGFASMLNTPPWAALASAIFGTAGNLLRLLLLENLSWPEWASATLGAMLIGLLAFLFGSRRHLPIVTMTVPAALIMIPGAPAFRALYWFVHGMDGTVFGFDTQTVNLFLTNFSKASLRIVGIGVGLIAARIITDHLWRFDMRHELKEL